MSDTRTETAPGPAPASGPLKRVPDLRAPPTEAMHMRATIGIFRRHLLTFLMIAALVPLGAWFAILYTPRQFTATGSLMPRSSRTERTICQKPT